MDKLSTEIEITPSIAAPAAYGSFSIQDILEVMNDSAGFVHVDDNDLIYIQYADAAFSMYASELVDIPNQISSETYIQSDVDIPDWGFIPVGTQYTFHKDERLAFSIEPEDRIDSIMIKSGTLNLYAYSEFRHAGDLNISSSDTFSMHQATISIIHLQSANLTVILKRQQSLIFPDGKY